MKGNKDSSEGLLKPLKPKSHFTDKTYTLLQKIPITGYSYDELIFLLLFRY